MGWVTDAQAWIAFATLLGLEIVLGIDNVVFISILAAKLPAAQQANARYWGLNRNKAGVAKANPQHQSPDQRRCGNQD